METPATISDVQKGKIQLILGPMFSGKSTELIRRLKRYQVAKYEVLIVKYALDVRYDEFGIATHDQQSLPAVSATSLKEFTEQAANYDVIGIDEGQFFQDIEWVEEMANAGKIVLIAALDGTYQRKPFLNIMDLIPLSESVTKLNAVCMICFGEASFTKRTSKEESLEVIGGSDKYMAVCRTCYAKQVSEPSTPHDTIKHDETNLTYGVSPTKRRLFNQSRESLGAGILNFTTNKSLHSLNAQNKSVHSLKNKSAQSKSMHSVQSAHCAIDEADNATTTESNKSIKIGSFFSRLSKKLMPFLGAKSEK